MFVKIFIVKLTIRVNIKSSLFIYFFNVKENCKKRKTGFSNIKYKVCIKTIVSHLFIGAMII